MQRTEACSILRQSTQASTLVVVAAATLLLLGCNGFGWGEAERQRAAAAARQQQLDGLVSRCRQQQPAVQKLVLEHDRSVAALSQLNQQRFVPLARPAAPDPAVMDRFTREDQELEQERYAQALARWREADGAERRRWEAGQEARRQELTARQSEAREALAKLDVAATEAARAAWSGCDRSQLSAFS
ncbi:hypothetical protein KBY65_11560 [Cyanobium sp. Alchichica 3B3-8F6]|uniref:hypothetical protein n=1 Tax=unclassified Cyanobium TaxID=2627006 RepID=UPI0020CCD609|nr:MULTISPECIES: hypothetical protein [unclassified Cyanobium]MCP9883106.1 hypothetical protein [Cyanobium sp. Alchichica 3B3-8F6]MCP9940827.1 hypothetical protein [Cyanobium sp. ATX 6E8]